MNIISAIKHGLTALKAGKSLNNLSAWKNAQAVTSLLASIVAGAFALGLDLGIDDGMLVAIGAAIAEVSHG